MPVFSFRFQSLLDRRIKERQQAEEEVASCQKELSAQKLVMKALEEDVQRVTCLYQSKHLRRTAAGVRGGRLLANESDFLAGLKLEVQAAQAGVLSQQIFVDEADQSVREAQKVLATRRLAVDVLEKYREKAEKRFLQESAYKEELEQDEIGNVIFLGRRSRK
jgi:flagellar biosynthesis chaperone FliJ